MKKRILSILLALCMCLTFVPVTVLADDLPQQESGISVFRISPDTGTYYTYKFYNGESLISEQIVKNGDTLLEPQVEAQDGKVFTGWDPEVPFGPVSELNGENKTIEVHAVFADGYYVYFKDNTGRIIATKTGTTGQKITFEDVSFAVGTGEAITGWYTDKDCTSGNKVTSVTIDNSNITLYAKVETGYWITFESNGGSYVAPVFYATSATAEEPAAPTKPGYTFAGWYTDKDLTAKAAFSTIKANRTVYAKWTAANQTKYTVIHWQENANDNGYSYQESEPKTGTTGAQTNATAKTYEGFTAQTITQQTIKGDGSTIVNVYYKRNEYSVKFYTNSTRRFPSKEYTGLRITAKYGAYIGDQWPTYNDSNNWATSDGGNTYQVNIDTMPLGGASFYGPKTGQGSETAYYYVEVLPGEAGTVYNGVTYKEHHHDTSPGTGFTVSQEDKYDITGFTYKEGTRNGNRYNNSKFYYTRNEYKIVFVNNGSTDNTVAKKFEQSIADASYTPTAPAGMTDYVFAGWYDNELGEGTAYVFDGKTMSAQNITLYAKWVAPTYTVTVYDVDGRTVLETFAKVPMNSTIDEANMPVGKVTKDSDDEFLGWVLKSDENSLDGMPFNFSTKITKDYELRAKVGSKAQYSVTYNANATGATGSVTDTEKYAKGAEATVKSNSFTNDGKVFLSWNTQANGTGTTYYPNSTVKITGDVTLYAQWGNKASTVSVTYHSNFGTDQTKMVKDIANNGQITVKDYSATGLPAREGYTFAGWKNNEGTFFSANDSARVNKDVPNDLYAQWRINQYSYTVEYYIDDVWNKSMTETAKADFGTEIDSYVNKCPTGYVLEKVETLPLTIGVTESENVIKVFYKKNVFNLTIHYVYADGGMAAADHTGSVTFGASYSVDSPTIDGYAADKTTVSGTMPANNVEVTVTYSKRTDLSYTVNYYWNGTTEKVADSKTVNNQTYGDEIRSEIPIDVDGYTALPNQSSNLTITTGQNVINFYYYKNVELTANSATYTYDGTEKSVSGFTGAPDGADFSDITVGAKGTNANTYPATFAKGTEGTVDTTKKYIVTEATDGQLEITKRNVTITGESASKTYNGKVQEITGITVEGLVDGHSLTGLTYSAKGKDAGKYDGTFTGQTVITDATSTNVTDNYNVKTVAGVLTITRSYRPSTPSTPSTPVTSVKTGDMGIALYAMTSLLSLSGAVAIVKKRKEDEK